ncbi:MAG: Tab2/Atab2 family RNA-binding protein [Limnothrix sp.]|uniref:Tab2/Atab2 family RNA-binding protein n=1 Tax=unclassified Limnothrix TaxID=2632864 RepID=UPI00081D368E|nr:MULTISPECIES: Tab2/Atab2 family RNA-binding protein [unclassified Limnothrix]MEB3118555.1 Tab2/Atab2 family RNA-binding protein [Limnothrix sp.]OCQ96220.1 hypothetical protein BCR12_14185 [Limnothrix sp. P13C2]MBD2162321.1 Tab2/Atab2 family RNA-binding protein [Limnothrix sp. FACHB-1083]MBD2193263.1 Tab2/Atab2 family RNA-binding protein [Limnothrix sp. FACHB-1088]MBD2555049.1 Tab2/Atab2 family RNA-binding protein [Limnothrix sp. FACHB-708]
MAVIWELDFYSRPILDADQKKVWEILICESPTDSRADWQSLFRYSKYCSNSEVNSVTLMQAIEEAIVKAGQAPSRIRFFRQAMKNMIVKACQDAELPCALSHRTHAIKDWIADRLETVYPQEPGYQATAQTAGVFMPPPAAQPLPDALLGQKWAFVSLEASAFGELHEWAIDFGEAFPLSMVNLAPDTPIPGLLIFSPRAMAISAWMSGLEMGFVRIEQQVKPSSLSSDREEFPDRVILETGIGDAWVLSTLPNAAQKAEGQTFEAQKQGAQGVHFLAVQTNPDEERFAGFWLMRDRRDS